MCRVATPSHTSEDVSESKVLVTLVIQITTYKLEKRIQCLCWLQPKMIALIIKKSALVNVSADDVQLIAQVRN